MTCTAGMLHLHKAGLVFYSLLSSLLNAHSESKPFFNLFVFIYFFTLCGAILDDDAKLFNFWSKHVRKEDVSLGSAQVSFSARCCRVCLLIFTVSRSGKPYNSSRVTWPSLHVRLSPACVRMAFHCLLLWILLACFFLMRGVKLKHSVGWKKTNSFDIYIFIAKIQILLVLFNTEYGTKQS